MGKTSILLVSGLLTYDSGKTWFVIGLAKAMLEKGYSVAVFKPVAGHNLWSQYKAFQYSVKAKMLLGEDVIKYISHLGIGDKPHVVNPIDILLAPPNPAKYVLNRNLISYLEDLDNQFKQIVLARYSDCEYDVSRHYIFRSNIENLSPHIQRIVEDFSLIVKAEDMSIEDFIAKLRSYNAEANLDKCLSRLSQGRDFVIVESFNDAATPYIKLLDRITTLFIVMPTAVAIYNDVEKIRNMVFSGIKKFGDASLRAYNLLHNIPPENIVNLNPRASEVENDNAFEELIKSIV